MKIVENIITMRDNINSNPVAGKVIADELGVLATNAIRYGMGSPAWETYMRKFATNQKELDRLMGNDAAFNNTEWGFQSLAYIVANSTCTIDTGSTGTVNNFSSGMKANLNAEPTP